MKILCVLMSLALTLFASGQETVQYSKNGLEAAIPKGFEYVDLSEQNPTASARGYFRSPDDSIRFYHERARSIKLFLSAKSEYITSADAQVLKRKPDGTRFMNYLTVKPVDNPNAYTRYLAFGSTTQTAGGVTQFGVQASSDKLYQKWKSFYVKFKQSVQVDEGH
ncbi:hypothetical protein Rhal01_01476 [Rubritalea halochordaticola]|uniref:DUF4468 domain-containing protein n=1 Tax=Rubritalea halochordaticola TaxID=714537 RepID=A0ABP9UXX3_9BACT